MDARACRVAFTNCQWTFRLVGEREKTTGNAPAAQKAFCAVRADELQRMKFAVHVMQRQRQRAAMFAHVTENFHAFCSQISVSRHRRCPLENPCGNFLCLRLPLGFDLPALAFRFLPAGADFLPF